MLVLLLLLLMDKILHDPKDPKLWEYGIFLIMGNAGFCPSTVWYSSVLVGREIPQNGNKETYLWRSVDYEPSCLVP